MHKTFLAIAFLLLLAPRISEASYVRVPSPDSKGYDYVLKYTTDSTGDFYLLYWNGTLEYEQVTGCGWAPSPCFSISDPGSSFKYESTTKEISQLQNGSFIIESTQTPIPSDTLSFQSTGSIEVNNSSTLSPPWYGSFEFIWPPFDAATAVAEPFSLWGILLRVGTIVMSLFLGVKLGRKLFDWVYA